MTATPCPIVILAAGGSTRMGGRDKLLETVDGQPLIRTQVCRALATGQAVFVTLPAMDHPRARVIADLDSQMVPLPDGATGISASLRAGVCALPQVDAFMVMLADLVAVQTADLNAVLRARSENPAAKVWRASTRAKKPGHPVIFDASLRPAFAQLRGDQGAAAIIATQPVHLVPIGDQALLDLDSPVDWAKWRART
ncbi:CTP:molybdopterin cytidylyltransferase MocA [Yoonia tamlensis]|uniref:CTP:molybdopterin cytidylyltransferase MocA n=1 Tax=Yoonia tamlensis TaxID=390270 RepID=A0A1I6GBD2_9RHOB|nr:CTP:molybdopterin cytidylyltransferase MocA [Yoonia tamlensis]